MYVKVAAPVRVFSGIEELYSISQPHVREGLESIGMAAQYYPGYTHRLLDLHSPAIVLFSFFVRGHCWHILGDNTYEETGGALGITHYGQCHDIITDENGADIMNLYVDLRRCPMPRLPNDLMRILPNILPANPCFQNRLNQRIRLVFSDPDPVAHKLFSIERELKGRKPGYLETALAHFSLFLIDCCRQALESGLILDLRHARPRDIRLEDLRNYLETSFADPLTLTDLAERVGVTPGYLCRAFKEYTGKTIFDYLVIRRIQEATILLRSSNEKIATVALQCGFNDLSYFNRKFKDMVRMRPTEYRRYVPVLVEETKPPTSCAPAV